MRAFLKLLDMITKSCKTNLETPDLYEIPFLLLIFISPKIAMSSENFNIGLMEAMSLRQSFVKRVNSRLQER